MILPAGCKPSKLCDRTGKRPRIAHAHLVKHDKAMWLCATNSYGLVALRVEAYLEPGWVPFLALRAMEANACKQSPVDAEQVSRTAWRVSDRDRTRITYDIARETDGLTFPDFAELDAWQDQPDSCKGPLGVGAPFLADLAVALGAPFGQVSLGNKGPLKPLVVRPANDDDGSRRGLLMSVRLMS